MFAQLTFPYYINKEHDVIFENKKKENISGT